MPTNYKAMFTPDLVSKKSPARKAEAQRRLDTQTLSPKNVRRLTAYLAAPVKADPTPAPKAPKATAPAKSDRPKVVTIDKKACWSAAEAAATSRGIHIRSAEFWALYKAETAKARSGK